jgi:N2227-like protein
MEDKHWACSSLTFEELEEEEKHVRFVLRNLFLYEHFSMQKINKLKNDYFALSEVVQQSLLPPTLYLKKIAMARQCIHANQHFLNEMTSIAKRSSSCEQETKLLDEGNPTIRAMDIDHVRSTLRQFVREWSHIGTNERMVAFSTLVDRLESYYESSFPDALKSK